MNFLPNFNGNSFPVDFQWRVCINNSVPGIHSVHLWLTHWCLTRSWGRHVRVIVLTLRRALFVVEFYQIKFLVPAYTCINCSLSHFLYKCTLTIVLAQQLGH